MSTVRNFWGPNVVLWMGGSFDPIHQGHIQSVLFARSLVGASRVILSPARVNPLKARGAYASDKDRLEIMQRSLQPYDFMELDEWTLQPRSPICTIDILSSFRQRHGMKSSDSLIFLMGVDAFKDLPLWKRPGDILTVCDILVISRNGAPFPDPNHMALGHGGDWRDVREKMNIDESSIRHAWTRDIGSAVSLIIQTEGPNHPASSTQIRDNIQNPEMWSPWMEPNARDYIQQHRVYSS